MTKLSTASRATDDSKMGIYLKEYERRIQATPPGMCPVALQLDILRASGCQTCGKCVPCREGIPELEAMLEDVLACDTDSAILDDMRSLAQVVRDTADCAIGWHAADVFLRGMDTFAEEYESHVIEHSCREGIAQTLPCETDCPAHVNVPGYIALAGTGDYVGTIAMIRKDNPFPTACAFVCEHPCEQRCRRMLIDAPVNIRGIKKFAVDQLIVEVPTPAASPATGRRIAVVGAGPSGLTCAYFLSLMGHSVTVFEGRRQLGGMMRYGIPAYRFPRERLDGDVRAILSAGDIEVRTEEQVDTAKMTQLAADYDVVYVAIGAQGGKMLDMPGTDSKGVMSAVDLLTRIGDGEYPDFTGKNVVVIGGGNVAMDCARTSVRVGAASVTVVYRRRLEDMTTQPDEVQSALAEGVEMMTLQAPDTIEVDEAGHCVALLTQPQYIGTVEHGRPVPQTADKPKMRIPADVVLIAIGQAIESTPFKEFGIEVERTRFVADTGLKARGPENVFVGGDCQVGPKTVIMAIGSGKVAARNIDEFLGYHHKLNPSVEAPVPATNDRTPKGRVNIAERPARERKNDFEGVGMPMSLEEAQQECGRCLRCDHFGCGAQEGGRIQYV